MEYLLNGDLEAIVDLAERIEVFGEIHRLPPDVIFKVNLCLDELLTNIIQYGFPGCQPRPILITLRLEQQMLMVEIQDDAAPFNPLENPEPDTTRSILDRPIGGLGIHLVRRMMDGLVYSRENGKNILTMQKSIKKDVTP